MRFAILRGRRGANNIVATMLIFGIIIASIGVLYGQISPALLGYEGRATTANQSYIFDSISQEVINLATSNEGSASRIHIVSENTYYDIENSLTLNYNISEGGVPFLENSAVIGAFQGVVNGSFQQRGSSVLNGLNNQTTYMNNNTQGLSYVLTSEYTRTEAKFSMYFKAHIDLHQKLSGDWKMTISIIVMEYISSPSDGSPLAFPIRIPEWTLRLRRQAVNIETVPAFAVTQPISLSQNLGGQDGETYTYPGLVGQNLEIEIITIPILFGI